MLAHQKNADPVTQQRINPSGCINIDQTAKKILERNLTFFHGNCEWITGIWGNGYHTYQSIWAADGEELPWEMDQTNMMYGVMNMNVYAIDILVWLIAILLGNFHIIIQSVIVVKIGMIQRLLCFTIIFVVNNSLHCTLIYTAFGSWHFCPDSINGIMWFPSQQ